jgi:hypothetical protein
MKVELTTTECIYIMELIRKEQVQAGELYEESAQKAFLIRYDHLEKLGGKLNQRMKKYAGVQNVRGDGEWGLALPKEARKG